MKVKLVDIDKIVPYARNPRRNEAAVDKVAASIKEFGWQQAIVVDEEMVVIAGHTRLLAAKKLGLSKIPIKIADELTDAQVKAYRLADNRTAEEADWDLELLKIEIEDLEEQDVDVHLAGFDDRQIGEILAQSVKRLSLAESKITETLLDPEPPDKPLKPPEPGEIPAFQPADMLEFKTHQLIIGHENPDIVRKILGFLQKERVEVLKNGEKIDEQV
jgi:ParB-like chromosome segregation protein Spo0J